MKFILTFTVPPETREAAMARFLETGGQPPPAVTLLGRWTQLDLCGGVVLLESEDPKALTAFTHGWSDVLELTLAPVLEDQDLADVLQRASAQPTQTEGRADGAGLPQAAAIVADQELPDNTHPEAVHGDLRAEEPAIAPSAGRRRTRRGAQARPEGPPVVPETTPGTTKPPYEEIA
jgi:hypothetical protein